MYGKVDQLFDRMPKARLSVVPVEAFREKEAATQYYPGSPDGSRKGQILVNTGDFEHRTLYGAEAIANNSNERALHCRRMVRRSCSCPRGKAALPTSGCRTCRAGAGVPSRSQRQMLGASGRIGRRMVSGSRLPPIGTPSVRAGTAGGSLFNRRRCISFEPTGVRCGASRTWRLRRVAAMEFGRAANRVLPVDSERRLPRTVWAQPPCGLANCLDGCRIGCGPRTHFGTRVENRATVADGWRSRVYTEIRRCQRAGFRVGPGRHAWRHAESVVVGGRKEGGVPEGNCR